MTRYIFITGGVVSSLGKGLASAALGALLQARGFTAHETCLRQGRNLWTFLHQTVQAWIGGTPAPSLLPQTETPVPTG